MEFLSEDIYGGGFYSGLPEAQPWYSMQGLTSPYGVYGLNRAGLLSQQNLPVTADGMLNIGVDIDGQAIMNQVEQNLANIGRNDTPPLPEEGPGIQIPIEAPDWLIPGGGGTVIITSGYTPNVLEVFEDLIGVQGVPEGTSPEVLAALEGRLDGADRSTIQQVAQEILAEGSWEDWLSSQEGEEVVDITQDDTTVADDSELADTTTPEDAQPIPDYSGIADPNFQEGIAPGVGSVGTGTTTSTPTTPMTPPPGSAGVIIDIEDLMNAGDWTVFLPGVIPGLPSSPTILGTVEEILNNPSGIFDDLLKDLEGIVTNPEQVLEDILNDAADSDGLITIGGIQSVISDIMDRIEEGPEATPAPITTEQDPTIIGGEERDEEEETIEPKETTTVEPEETTTVEPEKPTTEPPTVEPKETTTVEPEETTTVEPEKPTTEPPTVEPKETTTDSVLPPDSPEPQPEIGTVETEDSVSSVGGMLAASPFETDGVSQYGIAYQTPQIRQVVVPKKDYVAELDALIERSLFGRMI